MLKEAVVALVGAAVPLDVALVPLDVALVQLEEALVPLDVALVAVEAAAKMFMEYDSMSDEEEHKHEPYKTHGRAGAFFSFTSNVDAHGFDVFDATEIR